MKAECMDCIKLKEERNALLMILMKLQEEIDKLHEQKECARAFLED